jgi:hypothetical protein
MKKIILISKLIAMLIAILISANSYAGDYQNNENQGGGQGASIKADNNSQMQWQNSTAQSNSDSHSKSEQWQGSWSNGEGGQASSSNNGGNVAINSKSQSAYVATPGMYGSFSQASCRSSAALGVAVAGIGVGGGIPVKDEVCEGVIASQAWHSLGLDPVACNRLAQDERNAQALKDSGVSCNTAFVKETSIIEDNQTKDRLFKEKVSK